MNAKANQNSKRISVAVNNDIKVERTFLRFTIAQRWEHWALFLSITVLLLTGLPQKYRAVSLSQQLLSSPQRLGMVQQIHHIAAILLAVVVIYHLGKACYYLLKRRLSADIFPTWQDMKDAWWMIRHLLFLSKVKPAYGKYNFEQKITYWFLFLTIGLMGINGLIMWFPLLITRYLPGGIIPAAKLTHSTEAVVVAIFIIIWHFFHVLVQRLNLSMFTGRLSEDEMRNYHLAEHQRLTTDIELGSDEEDEHIDVSS